MVEACGAKRAFLERDSRPARAHRRGRGVSRHALAMRVVSRPSCLRSGHYDHGRGPGDGLPVHAARQGTPAAAWPRCCAPGGGPGLLDRQCAPAQELEIDTSRDDDENPQYQTSDFRVFYMKVRPGCPVLACWPPLLARPGVWSALVRSACGGLGAARSAATLRLRAGHPLLQALLPRLDDLPVRAPRREGAAQGSAAVCLHRNRVPRHEEGALGTHSQAALLCPAAQGYHWRAWQGGCARAEPVLSVLNVHAAHSRLRHGRGRPSECRAGSRACTDATGPPSRWPWHLLGVRLSGEQSLSYMRVASAASCRGRPAACGLRARCTARRKYGRHRPCSAVPAGGMLCRVPDCTSRARCTAVLLLPLLARRAPAGAPAGPGVAVLPGSS